MSLFRCRECDTVVRRGRFCSRCGMRQPPRVLRALLAVAASGAMVMAIATAFGRLEGGAPDFRPPQPSNGNWAHESDFLPDGSDDDDLMSASLFDIAAAPTSNLGAEVASR